jgi:N,N'-diacetyllegionaminate synthase
MNYKQNSDKVYTIAEIGQAHEGSVGIAHSMIDKIAKVGFDAVKFQMHFADEESSIFDTFRVKIPYLSDITRFDYWKRIEFKENDWKSLYEHSKSVGLDFICSPFSQFSLDLLEKIGCDIYKIASGEFFNKNLIDSIIETKKPIFISTGISENEEIENMLNYFIKNNVNDFVLFQCTSEYPCPPEKIGFNIIEDYSKRNISIGLSDHSSNLFTSIGAVMKGAKFIEVHVTFDKEMFGFDSKSSLTFEESFQMISGIKHLNTIINNPIDKNNTTKSLSNVKKLFTRSYFAKCDINQGELITEKMIILKKPGIGIVDKNLIIGKKALANFKRDDLINLKDLK